MSYYGEWCHTERDKLVWRQQFRYKGPPLLSLEFICRHRCYELHPGAIQYHPGIIFIDTTDWPKENHNET